MAGGGRSGDWPGVPDQDAAGIPGCARPGARLPVGCPGNAATQGVAPARCRRRHRRGGRELHRSFPADPRFRAPVYGWLGEQQFPGAHLRLQRTGQDHRIRRRHARWRHTRRRHARRRHARRRDGRERGLRRNSGHHADVWHELWRRSVLAPAGGPDSPGRRPLVHPPRGQDVQDPCVVVALGRVAAGHCRNPELHGRDRAPLLRCGTCPGHRRARGHRLRGTVAGAGLLARAACAGRNRPGRLGMVGRAAGPPGVLAAVAAGRCGDSWRPGRRWRWCCAWIPTTPFRPGSARLPRREWW